MVKLPQASIKAKLDAIKALEQRGLGAIAAYLRADVRTLNHLRRAWAGFERFTGCSCTTLGDGVPWRALKSALATVDESAERGPVMSTAPLPLGDDGQCIVLMEGDYQTEPVDLIVADWRDWGDDGVGWTMGGERFYAAGATGYQWSYLNQEGST